MQKIPECRSMNFSIYEGMLNRYKDSEDIRKSYESRGLNGLEVIRAGEPDEGKILPDMVNGVHLYFHIFWMDWWKGNYERLDQEFDSREQWLEYFGGMSRESYLNSLRDDLAYAEQVGAKYVVFHVSEVTLRESYIYKSIRLSCRESLVERAYLEKCPPYPPAYRRNAYTKKGNHARYRTLYEYNNTAKDSRRCRSISE